MDFNSGYQFLSWGFGAIALFSGMALIDTETSLPKVTMITSVVLSLLFGFLAVSGVGR